MIYVIHENLKTGIKFKSVSITGNESEYEDFKSIINGIIKDLSTAFKEIECKGIDGESIKSVYTIKCVLKEKIYDSTHTLAIPKEFDNIFQQTFSKFGMTKGKKQGDSRFPMFYKKSKNNKYYYALFLETYPNSIGNAIRAGLYATPYAPSKISGFRIVFRIVENNDKNAKFIGFKKPNKSSISESVIFESIKFI